MNNKDMDAMSAQNNEKRELVPSLRFPEFQDAGEWRAEPLRRLAKRCTSKNATGEHTRVLTNSAEYGVVDQRDYFERDIANQGNLGGYYIVEKGDYVYNPRISANAPVGPISRNNVGTGIMSPLYTIFRFFSSDNDFFAHYLKSTHWHHYLRQSSSTGARHDRMSITNDDFMGLPLPVSTPKEQQKIADCLSAIDELITAETQKFDTLKAHKKGLMQQLFPREGETVPKLRFPEFQNAPGWEEKTIGSVCKTFSGGTPTTLQKELYGGDIPFIRSAEIGKDYTELFLTNEGLKNSAAKLVNKGDVLIALYGANSGDVSLAKLDGAINQAILCLQSEASNSFIYHFLFFKKEWIVATYIQGGQGNLSGEIIRSLSLRFPAPEEQQKIADFLSSLNELISAESQKIDALKAHKKGFMQRLFPRVG